MTDPVLLPVLHYPRIISLELDFKRGHGDMYDLERLEHVEQLAIFDPLLIDISPLAQMTTLARLELRSTGAVALRDLPYVHLTSLEFDYENVVDPESLSAFKALTKLQISGLADDTIVTHLATPRAKLERFGLWDARDLRNLNNLISLSAFDSLDFLLLSGAFKLTSIAGIEKWARTLTGIYLMAPFLEDAERLAALPRLRFINLSNTPIRDIAFMAQLSELWVLHVGGVQEGLPDLAPLRDLDKLQYLYLVGNSDVDLTPLAGKANLEISIANIRDRRVSGSAKLGRGSRILAY